MSVVTLRRRVLGLAAASLTAIVMSAAPASAGVLVSSASSCADQSYTQPFLPWLDTAQYMLAPDGTFEQGAPTWSLGGGAATASGNEPFNVHGSGETASLALPSGASATSGAVCVGIEHPTLRLFAQRTGGSALGSLRVDVLYEDALGGVHSLPIGSVASLSGAWAPTAPMVIGVNLLTLLPDEHTAVAFRFSAQSSSWAIDDVYVDPWQRG